MEVSRVAWVTGASRGVGRGIALALGAEGWTVYMTGRTVDRLEAAAATVTERGGRGVVCPCDHRVDAEVQGVAERIAREAGRLDLLVNNVFAIPEAPIWGRPFWEQPLSQWDDMHTVGLRSHFVATVYAVPLLLEAARPLVVHISSFAGQRYLLNVAYSVGKAGVDRMAADMAHELRDHGVAVISLVPGVVRTEWVLEQAELPFSLEHTESPEFTGRAVVALADDPDVMARSGEVCVVAELAQTHGFDDIDGTRPHSLRAVMTRRKR